MVMPFHRELRIGAYLIKQKISGRKRYPLVLMLEPLFRCNLACVGCGKIDYPDPILNRRMSVQECLDAVDERNGRELGAPALVPDRNCIEQLEPEQHHDHSAGDHRTEKPRIKPPQRRNVWLSRYLV